MACLKILLQTVHRGTEKCVALVMEAVHSSEMLAHTQNTVLCSDLEDNQYEYNLIEVSIL
jgi:hypothetical protein